MRIRNKKLRAKSRRNELDNDLNLSHCRKKLEYLRKKRQIRKLQITLSRFRVLGRFVAICLIFWAITKIAFLPQWYLNPDIFKSYPNNLLLIEGNKIVTTRQIIDKLNSVKISHEPIYMLDTKPISKSVFALAPIEEVIIRRFWNPARLRIIIEEKKPVIAISSAPNDKPVAAFSDDATVIGSEFFPLPKENKLYLVNTHFDYTKWKAKDIKFILKLCQTIESSTGESLQYLDLRNPEDVFAQIKSAKLRLGEINDKMFNRAKRTGPILPEIKKIKEPIEYIDLRWDYPTIKLKSSKKNPNPIVDQG